jgi:hypothetical protein
MYVSQEKKCYETSETKFIVSSDKLDIADLKNAIQNISIGKLKNIDELLVNIFFVEMQNTDKGNLLELRKQLNAIEDVIYTSPIYVDERGLEASTYVNEIIVRLKSKGDYPILEIIAETYSIKDIVQLADLDEQLYLLTLPHNPDKDAAETSIELYETGLFDYAHPNILTLWPYASGNSNINMVSERSVVVYPNPVSDIFYVNLEMFVNFLPNTPNYYDIRLYNSQGNMCLQKKSIGGIVDFNVSNFPVGIYFLIIFDGSSSKKELHKIIVKH